MNIGILPQPLTAPETDLRGMPYMPLFGDDLFSSDTWITLDEACRSAAIQLWWAAWRQVPAASLPNDDRILAHLAGYGTKPAGIRAWRKVRPQVLRGFALCADGRLYHKFLADKAREVWEDRLAYRERIERERARKRAKRGPGDGADNAPIPADSVTENALASAEAPRNVRGPADDSEPFSVPQEDHGAPAGAEHGARSAETARNVRGNSAEAGAENDPSSAEPAAENHDLSAEIPAETPVSVSVSVREQPTELRCADARVPARCDDHANDQATEPIPDRSEPEPPTARSRDPAVALIEAFDAGIVQVFGEQQRRPWPAAKDHPIAQKLLGAGVSPDMVRQTTVATCQRLRGTARSPPKTLSYIQQAALEVLRESQSPLPEIHNGHPRTDRSPASGPPGRARQGPGGIAGAALRRQARLAAKS